MSFMRKGAKSGFWLLIIIFYLLTSGCRKEHPTKEDSTVIKDADGNKYSSITIGSQVWLRENLKTSRYSNGDLLLTHSWDKYYTSEAKFHWPPNDNESYADTYGRLYTWYVVNDERGICPKGYHVPTKQEWVELLVYLTSHGFDFNGSSYQYKIAKSLTYSTDWAFSPNPGAPGNIDFSSYRNKSGFTALPAGTHYNFVPSDFGLKTFFWSSSESSESPDLAITSAFSALIYHNKNFLEWAGINKLGASSVRCIKDR